MWYYGIWRPIKIPQTVKNCIVDPTIRNNEVRGPIAMVSISTKSELVSFIFGIELK